MNNKIILALQDKETILEVAKDPEVQIKIKDAIIDGVAKRVAKGAFDNDCNVSKQLREDVLKAMFEKTFLRSSFTKDYKEIFDAAVSELIEKSVQENIQGIQDKINKHINMFQTHAEEFLANYDFEHRVNEQIEKKLGEVVKKLVEK
jgi:hypothetical protein